MMSKINSLAILGATFLVTSVVLGCSSFGGKATEEQKMSYKQSKNFNAEEEIFVNRLPQVVSEMEKEAMDFKTMKDFFFGDQPDRVPQAKLPEVKPDLNDFLSSSEDVKIIWFGHSSFLLNIEGKTILVDPVFSNAAAPVSFAVKRFQAPVLKLEELPKIDVIVISHDHYDHLDMKTVKFFKEKQTMFLTPLGVGTHLEKWGIKKELILEKDWWQSEQIDGIKFVATPAQHFSGRGLFDRNHTLWASWVIQSKDHNIYFSGDSGYDKHFKEIGEKYGPFDIAFVENGQYNVKWRAVHLLPEETIQATKDLNAKKLFPVHWGMFELSMHAWYEPIVETSKRVAKESFQLVAPKIGQVVYLNGDNSLDKWWESVPKNEEAFQNLVAPQAKLVPQE